MQKRIFFFERNWWVCSSVICPLYFELFLVLTFSLFQWMMKIGGTRKLSTHQLIEEIRLWWNWGWARRVWVIGWMYYNLNSRYYFDFVSACAMQIRKMNFRISLLPSSRCAHLQRTTKWRPCCCGICFVFWYNWLTVPQPLLEMNNTCKACRVYWKIVSNNWGRCASLLTFQCS